VAKAWGNMATGGQMRCSAHWHGDSVHRRGGAGRGRLPFLAGKLPRLVCSRPRSSCRHGVEGAAARQGPLAGPTPSGKVAQRSAPLRTKKACPPPLRRWPGGGTGRGEAMTETAAGRQWRKGGKGGEAARAVGLQGQWGGQSLPKQTLRVPVTES
jgi:hypothetical protein